MYVGMFISRHKDNKEVPNFYSRTKMFFMDKKVPAYCKDFEQFIEEGQPGEMCRFYMSASERNMEKTQKELACRLIKESIDFTRLNGIATSIAMKPEQEALKKWLFDFDCPVTSVMIEFCCELTDMGFVPEWYLSPNGYSVIIEHGFDSREFLSRWNERLQQINPEYSVELKRNAMVIIDWETKSAE